MSDIEYQGDQALEERLGEAGVEMSLGQVKAMLAGVVSALAGRDMETWIELIAPAADSGADDALRGQLVALKARIEAESDPGFPLGPAPAERLALLRAELGRRGLDGFLVPRGDVYQSEYAPVRADRMRWLSGFGGTAGLLVVLAERAAIFVDGRYTLQVRTQVIPELFAPHDLEDHPPATWIAAHLPAGGKLGYDPWLHTERQVEAYRVGAEQAGGALVAQSDNPLDAIWSSQPPVPIAPVIPHDLAYAGEPAAEKRLRLGAGLARNGVDAAVITAPDSVAWLLNIRGADIPRTPLPLSTVILHRDGTAELFIDPRKLTPVVRPHLDGEAELRTPDALAGVLEDLGGRGATVQVDPGIGGAVLERELGVASAVTDALRRGGAVIRQALDPCAVPKAWKNQVEIQGARNAHRRDGAAMTRFLAWLAREAPKGGVTELAAARRLNALRGEGELFVELSILTISGTGPNSAFPHYRPTEASNRTLRLGDFYVCDSGAQYLDGTTDVTRTVAIGTPSEIMKDRATRVLRAHIALATARFPQGTRGQHLDGIARRPLWEAGLDFGHGTGHGVGSHLNVHEGPQSISKAPLTAPFTPGVIMSNEPGYYEPGAYGVRHENLVLSIPCAELPDADPPFLAFETLTAAPFDLNLLEPALMTADEIRWLDSYHGWVRERIAPLVDGETVSWLDAATRPLAGEA